MRALFQYLNILLVFCVVLITSNADAACAGMNTQFVANQTFFCGNGPHTVNFTNTTSGSTPTTTFDWYQNGVLFGSTATTAAPQSAIITSSGVYTYMLIATDSNIPCSDTFSITITVAPQPNSSFSFSPNNTCALSDVSFTNNSSGLYSNTTYLWDFGDGFTSTDENPTHQYAIGGSYTTTLTVNNGAGCTSSSSQTVTILDAPITNIAGDDGDGNLTYCLLPGDNTSSETVTFSNTTTGANTYTWTFGDGSPPFTTTSLANFTHTYTTYGTFEVVMVATHANGCQASDTLSVIFEKFVSAALTLDITEYSGCTPHGLSSLTNLSVNATNFIWNFGDGTIIPTSTLAPPAYNYTAAGNYTITLTASNSCNTATATISPIVIIDSPTSSFTPSVTAGCAPQTVTFTNSSTGTQPANNYVWDMGNGNTYTNTVTPPAQTYPNSGSYTVSLTSGNACGTNTVTQTITIDTIPTVDLILDPVSGCSPLNVDPTATLLSGSNVNWNWLVNSTSVSNAPFDIPNQNFPSLNPNDSTAHTIQVIVSNGCGSDSDIGTVYVNPPVIAAFTTQNNVCLGTPFTFTNQSTGTELSYEWDFGDGSPLETTQNASHTYASAGNYVVTLTTTGICGVDQATFNVTVIDFPVIDISVAPASICSGETGNFTNNSSTSGSYLWDFGAMGSPSSSTQYDPGSVVFTGSGTQTVYFTVNNSGCSQTDSVEITVSPLPIPDFSVTPLSGCSPLSTAITNNTLDAVGTTYNWDYGNGSTSVGYTAVDQTFSASFNDTTFTVQLIVTTSSGCIDSLEQTVSVFSLPIADFTVSSDTVCEGTPISFTNTSSNATSYLWEFGDGNSSNVSSPSHTYASNGLFQVMLVAQNANNCSDTTYQNVFIDSIPIASFVSSIECLGFPTVFTNTSTGSPTDYSWDFGDGSPTSTVVHPTHTYATDGIFNATLIATNAVGCSNSVTLDVQVNNVPIADFSWGQTCQGDAMSFTDQSLNSPTAWDWDFGDGSSSSLQHPSHFYADTGTYTVQIVVSSGSGCADSITQTVYVDSIPTANFSALSVCTNDTTYFTDLSLGSPDTFSWDFGDFTTSNLQNPPHVYSAAGPYFVIYTVGYSSSGCTNTYAQDVDALPRTVPAFTATVPCLGDTTFFVDQTTGSPTLWEWDFGDGSLVSTVQTPSHLYAAGGFYNVTLITENSFGCSDTLIQQIEIYGLPVADFSATTVCQGALTQFTDNSTDDVAWEWNFGDGSALSSQENPTHIFNTNGSFNVTHVVFNPAGCSDTISQLVTVNPNPTAGFFIDTACFGYLTSFTDTSLNAISWQYDFGDATGSGQSNPTHVYPSEGTFTVQQTVTNVFGCMDSTTVDAIVYPQPEAGFNNITVCAQDVVSFTDTTLGSPTDWQWNFGDGNGTSTDQHPTYIYTTGGLYDVQLISGNSAGCLDTTTVTIEVYTNPVALFEADSVCYLNITSFTDLSNDVVPIVSWEYNFGDGISTSTLQNPTYIYQQPGIYPASLTVTNIHGCDSTFLLDVIVYDVPSADFTFDTVCWGSPTTFTDISTGTVATWDWNFGDGTSSNVGPIETHTYAMPGNYLASLTVDGGSGCTDIWYHVVTVTDVLTPLIGGPSSVCLQEPVQFQDLSVASSGTITGWNWDFGDGNTSTLQHPIHTYLSPGTYTVALDVQTSDGCSNTGTFTISIEDTPAADFSFTIPCEGQPTIFTDNSSVNTGAIAFWQWNFGDGSSTSYSQSPNHTYASAGNYTVTLVVESSSGCFDTIQQTVTINPSPSASFVNNIVCGGEPLELVNTSVGNIVDYNWMYNGTTFSTDESPIYTFPTTTDTHPVTLIITTDLGCTDTLYQDVVTRPVVIFDYGPLVTSGCPVLEVNFYENSTVTSGGSIISWLWNLGDSTYSFNQLPTHYYEDPGSYSISLEVITSQDCIYSDTLPYSITVYPKPTANFFYSPIEISMFNPEVDFTNTATGAQNVEWHFGDFDYSNEWHPTHVYTDTGYYLVEQIVYNEFGCSDSIAQWLYVEDDFVAYIPNSFTPDGNGMNDFFNVSGDGIYSYELFVFNRWGTVIATITDFDEGWDGTYNGNQCQDGVYVWLLRAIDYGGVPRERTGHVTLLR